MQATLIVEPTESAAEVPVGVRVYRSVSEIEAVREIWSQLGSHPNSDVDFYRMIQASRSQGAEPYIAVVYRGESPEAMAIGRIEQGSIELKLGYAHLPSPRARILNI